MQKILAFLLAMGFVGSAMVVQRVGTTQDPAAQMANDGAFRDGLYVGRLAHAANREMRPPVGRWSTEKDRASFVAGYRQAFAEQSPQQ
jgi:hypothetical protein